MRVSRRSICLEDKIKKADTLSRAIALLKVKGKKIVFTNGCFDILHFGHVKYLQDAKAKGDILIVGINSDSSVRRLKGDKRPIVSQKDRASVIAGLASVDFVTFFSEDTPFKLIARLKPDILVKGADWNKDKIIGADLVRGWGGKVLAIRLAPGRSTSNLIKKIAQLYQK